MDRLSSYTGLLDEDATAILGFARGDLLGGVEDSLIQSIDFVVDQPEFIQEELSERLAAGGLLPMFGFPSQVRSLYRRYDPNLSHDEMVLSDRPLDHAIWSFSPGSEIPKDKRIYTCTGFVHKIDSHRGVTNLEDPLGPPVDYSQCDQPACNSIQMGIVDNCNVCGELTRHRKLFQPRGFEAAYEPFDYESGGQQGGSVVPPKLAFMPDYIDAKLIGVFACPVERG